MGLPCRRTTDTISPADEARFTVAISGLPGTLRTTISAENRQFGHCPAALLNRSFTLQQALFEIEQTYILVQAILAPIHGAELLRG